MFKGRLSSYATPFNLDPQNGHCYSTKYILTHLNDNVIEAVVEVRAYQGNRLFIPKIPIRPSKKSFSLLSGKALFIASSNSDNIYKDSHFFSHGQY